MRPLWKAWKKKKASETCLCWTERRKGNLPLLMAEQFRNRQKYRIELPCSSQICTPLVVETARFSFVPRKTYLALSTVDEIELDRAMADTLSPRPEKAFFTIHTSSPWTNAALPFDEQERLFRMREGVRGSLAFGNGCQAPFAPAMKKTRERGSAGPAIRTFWWEMHALSVPRQRSGHALCFKTRTGVNARFATPPLD